MDTIRVACPTDSMQGTHILTLEWAEVQGDEPPLSPTA